LALALLGRPAFLLDTPLRGDALFLFNPIGLDDPFLDLAEDMGQARLETPRCAIAPVRLVPLEDAVAS
jgi:hypothetical protein